MEFLEYIFQVSTLTFIIGTVIIIIFGYLTARSKNKQTPKLISIIGLIAGILILVSTAITGYENSNYEKENIELSNKNISLITKITELTKININLTSFIAQNITGGNSFCYFELCFRSRTVLEGILMHVGKYPLHDISIRLVDGNKLNQIIKEKKTYLTEKDINESEKRIYKNTFFKPGQGNFGEDDIIMYLPSNDTIQKYSIFFTARNGEWHQSIVLVKDDGKWIVANRVAKQIGDSTHILHERINKKFPKNKDGEIDW